MHRFLFHATVLLAVGGLMSGSRLAAQNDASDSFCILPLYNALTRGVPDATLQAEMDKLKVQIGPGRRYFKVGFSQVFGSAAAGANAARMAAANGLSCGFIIALQTHDVSPAIAAAAAQDLRLYQWRLDGKTWRGVDTDTAANPAYPPRDGLAVTPSRYAAALQNSFKSQVQTTARQIKAVMTSYPGTVVVVNGLIEEELATGNGTDAYLADYSPFAVTEFRDWLRHTGMYDDRTGPYAGQGAPAAITGAFVTDSQGVSSSPFHDDPGPAALGHGRAGQTFNATFGTHFATWTLLAWDLTAYPDAITDPTFAPLPAAGATGNTTGGFDAPRVRDPASAYWNAWSYDVLDHHGVYPAGNPSAPAFGFRQVMVKHFVNDLLGWVVAAGVPKEIVYAHQIPGETAGANRLRTGADPMWTGKTELQRPLGRHALWRLSLWHRPDLQPELGHLRVAPRSRREGKRSEVIRQHDQFAQKLLRQRRARAVARLVGEHQRDDLSADRQQLCPRLARLAGGAARPAAACGGRNGEARCSHDLRALARPPVDPLVGRVAT